MADLFDDVFGEVPDEEDSDPVDARTERAASKLGDDDIGALSELINRLEARMAEAPPDKLGPLATSMGNLIVKRNKMRPVKAKTDAELEAEAGPRAADVTAKILSGILAVGRIELESGTCHRCGQPLTPELIEARQAEVNDATSGAG